MGRTAHLAFNRLNGSAPDSAQPRRLPDARKSGLHGRPPTRTLSFSFSSRVLIFRRAWRERELEARNLHERDERLPGYHPKSGADVLPLIRAKVQSRLRARRNGPLPAPSPPPSMPQLTFAAPPRPTSTFA